MASEDKEDYAVRAAREWLALRFDFTTEHTAICAGCTAQLAELATIIRKHVDEAGGIDTEPCDHLTIDCSH